jgi:ubiquinone biosynthesis monooxygenase Coq6
MFRRCFSSTAKNVVKAAAESASASASTSTATAAKTPTVSISDILIIGGGPAGLSLASAIKSSPVLQDLKCTLVEGGKLVESLESYYTNPPEYIDKRVVSITPTSTDFFKKIGGWDYVKEERIQSYDFIHTYDGVSGAKMEFDSPELATMIENVNIQSMLYQRIKTLNYENPGQELQLLDNTKVVDIKEDSVNEWPVVTLSNGDVIKTRLLVGCDGYNSPARKYAQIESRGWSYNRWGNVATCKYKDTEFRFPTGWQRFLPTGTLAFLPLPNNWCSLVWAVPPEISNILGKLNDDQFTYMLNAAAKLTPEELQYLYKVADQHPAELIDEIKWRLEIFNHKLSTPEQAEDFPLEIDYIAPNSRAKFPLKLSNADSYVEERVALVGDAAHTTNPLAGQGLNMGQADVKSLVETLERARSRGLDIGAKFALEPYWSERFLPNHVMLGIVDKIHKVYSTDFKPLVWARSLGVNALNSVPFVKDWMVTQISHKD